LLFLIPSDAGSVKKQYEILLDELRRYNPELLDKSRVIAITKSDLLDDELKTELAEEIEHAFDAIPHVFISSIAQKGLQPLKDLLWKTLNEDRITKA
jgi:GTP-binding protein